MSLSHLLAVLACAPDDGLGWAYRLVGLAGADGHPTPHPAVVSWLRRLAHA